MKQQRRFTKEFEDEVVRLVRTSGRTGRQIAEDLGVGLPTLVRSFGRSLYVLVTPGCGSRELFGGCPS
jgi:transposase